VEKKKQVGGAFLFWRRGGPKLGPPFLLGKGGGGFLNPKESHFLFFFWGGKKGAQKLEKKIWVFGGAGGQFSRGVFVCNWGGGGQKKKIFFFFGPKK